MIFQLRFGEPKKEEEPKTTQVPTSEKSTSLNEFLRTPEMKKIIYTYTGSKTKNPYTKRGITKLAQTLWPSFDSNKKMANAISGILKSLRGEDGLQGFLNALKLIPEGIMKGLK
ncbi:hypothetical protein HYT84_01740 [Candidatus Micrarchaeota archaeon]|nr:hypothetical protein [Candidatus Micrarchaeota archaeon]